MIAAGITPAVAAEILGISRERLRAAWRKCKRFQELPAQMREELAGFGVPADIWPRKKTKQ
jgi:hypothetical protein